MKFEVAQKKLAKSLAVVSKIAAGTRATLPILNNVLIKVVGEKVSLTATDLDMAVVDYLPASEMEEGAVTVPARLLADFVQNLPSSGTVKIEASDAKVTISSGKFSSVINGALAEDFPELPGIDESKTVVYRVPVEDFKQGVGEVAVAASHDLSRPVLTGVFFNTNEGDLYLAATDGYRMTEKKFITGAKSEVAAIVPAVALQEVVRSLSEAVEEVEILFDESQVRFRLDTMEITSKLIDGSFPQYRLLIPQHSELDIEVDRDEMLRAAKLSGLFAKGSNGAILLEFSAEENKMVVKSVNNEMGGNDTEIELEVEADKKTMLNVRYLIVALNLMNTSKVRMHFSPKLEPVVIMNADNDDYKHLVMPLNIATVMGETEQE